MFRSAKRAIVSRLNPDLLVDLEDGVEFFSTLLTDRVLRQEGVAKVPAHSVQHVLHRAGNGFDVDDVDERQNLEIPSPGAGMVACSNALPKYNDWSEQGSQSPLEY